MTASLVPETGARSPDQASDGGRLLQLWRACSPYLPGASSRRARKASERLSLSLAALNSAGSVIDDISNLTQERFLAFCAGLEKLHATTFELVNECERLLVLASGREDGQTILDSTLDLISRPLDFISSWSGEADSLIDRLREALHAIEKLSHVETSVRRTLAPLRYIHTLFGVETAHMSVEFQTVFLKVREDIDMLQRRMDEAFAQQFDAIATIRAELGEIVSEISADATEQRAIVEKKREQIAAAIAQSREDIRNSEHLDTSLARVAREVSEEVSHIVVAVQSQDIVAQKLSHIAAAVEPVTMLASRLAAHPSRDPETALQLEQVSRVQIAQTESAGQDMDQARQAMGSAVEIVVERIAELDHECLVLSDFKNVTAGVKGIVQVLLDTTAEVGSMVKAAATASDRATEKVQPLAELASNLTGSMDLVAHSMRLIALNAQVQAVRLGQGTGVEVLSAETARISEETSRSCQAAVAEITTIGEFLGKDLAGFRDLRARAHELDRGLAEDGASSDKRLHHYRDSTLASLSKVGDLVQLSRDHATSLLALLNFGPQTANQICKLRELFSSVESAAAHCLAAVDRSSVSSAAESLEHNYTMHAERAVHAEVLGAASEHQATAEDQTTAVNVDNGELELF